MKIKGLETTIKQTIYDYKNHKNYLDNTLDTLNNLVISLNKDINKKNDELLQAQKVMEAMSVLNHGLKGDIEKLKDNLQGAIDKGIEVGLTAKEHEKHLLNDIALYFNWVRDLDKNLKELEAEKQKKESLRDQELTDLRQEIDNLKENHAKFIEEIGETLEDEGRVLTIGASEEEIAILRVEKVIHNLKNWENQFQNQTPQQVQEKINNLQTELQKELSWWDKWINVELIRYTADGTNYTWYEAPDYGMSRNYPDLSTGLSSFGFSYGKLKGKGYCLYHGSAWGRGGTEGHKQSIKELKELIKKIYEYYKNK